MRTVAVPLRVHGELRQPVEGEDGGAPPFPGEDVGDVGDAGLHALAPVGRAAEGGEDVVAVEPGVVPQRLHALARG